MKKSTDKQLQSHAPKFRVDQEAVLQERFDEIETHMDEIRKREPESYHQNREWNRLREERRLVSIRLERTQNMKQNGAKF